MCQEFTRLPSTPERPRARASSLLKWTGELGKAKLLGKGLCKGLRSQLDDVGPLCTFLRLGAELFKPESLGLASKGMWLGELGEVNVLHSLYIPPLLSLLLV